MSGQKVLTEREMIEMLERQNEFIERISDEAIVVSMIADDHPEGYVVFQNGVPLLLKKPEEFDLEVGDAVLVHNKSHQIIRRLNHFNFDTHTGVVSDIDDGRYFIMTDHGNKWMRSRVPLEIGDRVSFDTDGRVVYQLLYRPPQAKSHVDVSWDEVVGCVPAKRALKTAIAINKGHAMAKRYKLTVPKGFLFHGKPGNGKTLLGKAAATALGSREFFYIKSTEILSKYVGDTEAHIRAMFRNAKAYYDATGIRPVLFIDEAEAILRSRGKFDSPVDGTIVPTFLTEMDGLEQSGVIVILATNRPEILDEAVIRENRIDMAIEITPPTAEEAKQIVDLHLRGIQLLTPDLSSKIVDRYWSGSSPRSGAYWVERVNAAKRSAFERDSASGIFSGVGINDI